MNTKRKKQSALPKVFQPFENSSGGRHRITTSRANLWTTSLLFLSLVLSTSCGTSIGSPDDLPPVGMECRTQLRVAVVIDESTSMITSGTAPVKTEELRPLIDALVDCGGVLGVGFIRDVPQPGMERIDFPQPPMLPEAPVMLEGEQTYEFDDRVAAFNQLRVERAASVSDALEKKKPEIDGYFHKIDDQLVRPGSKATDLNSALNAADLFLSEPVKNLEWQKTLIIVSDGLDNRRKFRRPFTSGARVLWVNSTSDDKVLSDYGGTRVEALKAAVDDVINKLQTRGAK